MSKNELYTWLVKELEKKGQDEKIDSEATLIKLSKLSRGSVREVLIKLQSKGFIYVIAKKGYYKKGDTKKHLNVDYERRIVTKELIKTNLFTTNQSKTLHLKKIKELKGKIIEYQEIYFNYDLFINLINVDFTQSLEHIIKVYSDTNLISMEAKVKVVPASNLYKFESNFDQIMFSNYVYFNEYGEVICLVHSYFSLEHFNINYQKTM